MANRSYLYATDLIPSHANAGAPRRIVGLSECKYAVPALYGVLMCGSTELCLSNIWQFRTEEGGPSQPLALAAPMQEGLENLRFIRRRVVRTAAVTVLDEAISFLERPENQLLFLLLELAEYFSMFDEADEPRGKLHEKVAFAYRTFRGDSAESFLEVAQDLNSIPDGESSEGFARAVIAARDRLGYCTWSNILYYDPSANGE